MPCRTSGCIFLLASSRKRPSHAENLELNNLNKTFSAKMTGF
jgi:hypothetical protein